MSVQVQTVVEEDKPAYRLLWFIYNEDGERNLKRRRKYPHDRVLSSFLR